MAAMSPPTMGPLLRLSPPEHEHYYWRSRTFRAAAASCDMWTLYITLVTNSLYIRWHMQLPATMLQWALVAFNLAAALGQQLWARRAPHHYHRHRWLFVILTRLTLLCSFSTIPIITRTLVTTPARFNRLKLFLHRPTSAATPPSPNTELLAALRYIPLASCSAIALVHGITNPLPFLPQVAVHIVYTAIAVIFQLHPALTMLRLLPPEPFQQLCHALNITLQLTSTTLVGSAVNLGQAASECTERADTLLVLFADVYCCLLLPAYVAYRFESCVKQQYIQAVQRAQLGEHRALAAGDEEIEMVVDELVQNMVEVACPGMGDIVVVLVLAGLAWVTVLFFHGPLEAVALPM